MSVGQYAALEVTVDLPTEVPGLTITVAASGTYKGGKPEDRQAEVAVSLGLRMKLGSILDISARAGVELVLFGPDLGRSFVDAIKQSARQVADDAGIPERLEFAARVEQGLVGLKERYNTYPDMVLPIGYTLIADGVVGKRLITDTWQAYQRFFTNDASARFEAVVFIKGVVHVEQGDSEVEYTALKGAGLEDEGPAAAGFTEFRQTLDTKSSGGIDIAFESSTRTFADRTRLRGSLDVAFSIPRALGGIEAGAKLVLSEGVIIALRSALIAAAPQRGNGGSAADTAGVDGMKLKTVGEALALTIGEAKTQRLKSQISSAAGAELDVSSKFGLLVDVEFEAGQLTNIVAELRDFLSADVDTRNRATGVGVESTGELGAYVNLSADFSAALSGSWGGASEAAAHVAPPGSAPGLEAAQAELPPSAPLAVTRAGFVRLLLETVVGPATSVALAYLDDDTVGKLAVTRGLMRDPKQLRVSDAITRAEAVVMVVRALKIAPLSSGTIRQTFADLPASDGMAPEIYAAVLAGVVHGFGDWTFRPTEALSEQDATSLLAKAAAPDPSHRAFDPRKGVDAVSIAKGYVGKNSSELKKNSDLRMDPLKSNATDCANFVSAVLEKAGLITHEQRSNAVRGLVGNLRKGGWQDVSLADARRGDVVAFIWVEGGQERRHVEFYAPDTNGNPGYVGSNNINPDNSQRVSTDTGTWVWSKDQLEIIVLREPSAAGSSAKPS